MKNKNLKYSESTIRLAKEVRKNANSYLVFLVFDIMFLVGSRILRKFDFFGIYWLEYVAMAFIIAFLIAFLAFLVKYFIALSKFKKALKKEGEPESKVDYMKGIK